MRPIDQLIGVRQSLRRTFFSEIERRSEFSPAEIFSLYDNNEDVGATRHPHWYAAVWSESYARTVHLRRQLARRRPAQGRIQRAGAGSAGSVVESINGHSHFERQEKLFA
jgi:hypothetical protein